MAKQSLLPSDDVATRLAIAKHVGYERAGIEADDAAVSVLYLSKVQPGHYLLVRAVRPGYVGRARPGREAPDQRDWLVRADAQTGVQVDQAARYPGPGRRDDPAWQYQPGHWSSRRCGAAGHDQRAYYNPGDRAVPDF
jgi:hypothetical protein